VLIFAHDFFSFWSHATAILIQIEACAVLDKTDQKLLIVFKRLSVTSNL
jgi:hypothetical protein